MLKLQYFASIREQLNKSEEAVVLPEKVNDVSDLIEYMKNNDSDFNKLFEKEHKVLVAVNQTMVNKSFILTKGDEVAFFPPMTGG